MTVVPIIGMSDQTHQTNFSGDKKAWPVYITIGNLPLTRRKGPGSMAVLLALLPLSRKFAQSSGHKLQRQINANTLQVLFEIIFESLRDTTLEGFPMDCCDGKIRRCFVILSGWNADQMENAILYGLETNPCPQCEIPPYKLATGANHHLARNYDKRNKHYERLDIKTGPNSFLGVERVAAPNLHMPDLLHTIYLGLFKHMMDWIQRFLKKHLRQQAFCDAWKALPSYPRFYAPKTANRGIAQWQGKEMRILVWCLLGVLTVALRQPDTKQVQHFKYALTCDGSLLDFGMMAQYRTHPDETIQYMEDYLNLFHETKYIFLVFWISKQMKARQMNC